MPDTLFRCVGESGRAVPLQTRVTAWWPDGSMKWTAHTARCRDIGHQMEVLPADNETPETAGLKITGHGSGFIIRCTHWQMVIPGPGPLLVEQMEADGRICLRNIRP